MTKEIFARNGSWILEVIRDKCELTQAETDYLDFLIEVLEQEPCEDCISRKAVIDGIDNYIEKAQSTGAKDDFISFEELVVKALPSIQPKTDVVDKIRAEIEQNAYQIVHGVNNHEKGMTLYGILQIIDKYKAEGSNKDTDKGNDCNSCKYQKEVDGSNCYECVKGVRNNYTAESEG